MRTREMIKAMREMVRDMGRTIRLNVNGEHRKSRVLYVPIALVCPDDKTTRVEITYDGYLSIMGWDGKEGCGDNAETFKREEIERLYTAMREMGNEEVPRDCWGYPIEVGQRVSWCDPETGERSEYKVYEIHNEELVRLTSPYGECEAMPHECKILSN